MIIHLNDQHKWTREQIADWLETLSIDLRFKTPVDESEVDMLALQKKAEQTIEQMKNFGALPQITEEAIQQLKEAFNEQD